MFNTFITLVDRRGRILWTNQFPYARYVWFYGEPIFNFIPEPDEAGRVREAFAACVVQGESVDLDVSATLVKSPDDPDDREHVTYQCRYYPADIESVPRVASVILSHVIPAGVSLSEADKEVLKGLMDDKTIKEIADALDKAPSTIDARVKSLKDKLGVQTLPGLVAAAMRSYLI